MTLWWQKGGGNLLAAAACLLAWPAAAQEAAAEPEVLPVLPAESGAAPATVLDEIVVTAQKRVERLQDVPISMSAYDNAFMQAQAITDFRDLSLYVPNARIDANGTLPQLSIRGFNAHPLNRSFEQAIALVVDGIPYGTSPYFQLPLFDIARVEVLRGPQGTLYGKNSTAGLFNIATQEAGGETLSGSLNAQAGELGRQRYEAAVGGPLLDGVHFRIAGLFEERDGLMGNTSAATIPGALPRTNGRERSALRLKLLFDEVLDGRVNLSYEKADVRLTGFGSELVIVAPRLEALYRAFDADFDDAPDNFLSSVDGPELTTVKGDSAIASFERGVGDWGVNLTAGYSRIRFHTLADTDFGPQPMLLLEQRDTHPQTTLELRLNSPALDGLAGLFDQGESTLTTGLFWQRRDLADTLGRLYIDPLAAGLFLAADRSPTAPPAPPPGSIPPNDPADDEIGTIYFEQAAHSMAAYGQLDWRFVESTVLQLGLRYSIEDKTGDWNTVTEQGTGALAFAALGREPYTAHLEREEKNLSPKLMLRYELSEDASFYAGWVRSFRSGGFNQIASRGDPVELQYDEERVRSWEAGSKLSLAGGAAKLNIGLFWMILDNYQVLTQDPDQVGFTVRNAGKARARGVEIDGRWLLAERLSLNGALGYNDSEFLDFPFGTCTADNQDSDGDGDERCDLRGEPLDFAPRLTASLSPRLGLPLPWAGLEIVAGFSGLYQDGYFADVALRDPRVRQRASTRWNADLGLSGAGWTLRVIGENLSDERVAVFKSDVPLATGTFYQTPEPGRLIFTEFSWRF